MDNNNGDKCPNNIKEPTEEVDDVIPLSDDNNDCEEGLNDIVADIHPNGNGRASIAINNLQDMANINFRNLSATEIMKYHFPSLGVAFSLYNWYARLNGFSARKSKIRRNKDEEVIQQNFVCYKQGYKEDRFGNHRSRKREARTNTRCGCDAKCHVHIDESGRWYVKYFNDVHNHMIVDEDFIGLLGWPQCVNTIVNF